jgi:mono/diheme cytochrome c family protein
MPYFADLLSADEFAAVVRQVKSFSTAFSRLNKQIEIPTAIPRSLESVARGKALFVSEGCATCHGEEGRGGQAFDDESGHQVFARDLTAPWAFRGGGRAEDIWLRLTTGIMPGPMPSYADVLSADARWDLANFVVSLARKPPWEKGGSFGGAGFTSNLVQRGAYIARWEVCGLCHTQIDPTGIYNVDGAFLAGGMRVGYYPHGYSVSRNLTSDAESRPVERAGDCPRATRWPSAGPGAQSVCDALALFSQFHERGRDGHRYIPENGLAAGA